LAESANVQKLHTSAQPLSAWRRHPGWEASAGTVGEVYRAQWVYLVSLPTTRLIVEVGGYQSVAGTTVWRLYSDSRLYTEGFSGAHQVAEVSINWTAHDFSAPVFLTVEATTRPDDGTRITYLVLTSENLDDTTAGRLYTVHARPAPDEP
jgi:hypothetical protein